MLHARHPLISSLMWSLGMVAPIVLAGFLLPVLYPLDTFNTIVIPFCLWILPPLFFLCASRDLYEHITGHRPYLTRYDHNTGYHINKHTVYTLLELYASLAISIAFFLGLLRFLEPPYLLTSVLFCLCALIYVAIRLTYRLQPAYEERAANEQKRAAEEARQAYEATLKPQTPRDVLPLLTLAIQGLINQKSVIIGRDANSVPIYYHEERDKEEQMKHTEIVASTGYGKTTCELNLITQHIYYGNGVIVLAAESDLFLKLLPYIPEERANDLIYFEPEDLTPPIIGFNPFTLGAGENVNQKIGETRTILKRAMGKDLGHTMVPMIDNVVSALVRRPHATFADVMQLLNPANKTVRASLKTDPTLDPKERDFWKDYDETTYYRTSYTAVYNRFSRFAESPISTVLNTSSFSFKDILNTRHAIIFLDLSQLRDTAPVTMGQMLLASIEQDLLSRNNIYEPDRIPYYLLIDEFQKYAEDSEDTLKALYNGARKFKLGVTVAYQSTANIPNKLLDTISDNVGTTIALRLSANSSPRFAKQLQLQSPILLQNLKEGQAYVQTPTHQIGIPVTIPAEPVVPLPKPVPNLKARSKQNFGTEPSVPSTEYVTDQPDPPKPPVPQKKKSFGITFE